MFNEGVISAIIFGAIIQWYIGRDVEILAGWLRMIAIYVASINSVYCRVGYVIGFNKISLEP